MGLVGSLSGMVVVGLAAVVLGGCASEEDVRAPGFPGAYGSPSRGVWIGQDHGALPPEVMGTPRVATGPQVHVFAGKKLGYELTAEGEGRYRFRWTTDNLVHHTGVRRFHGSVFTTGHFVAFTPGCDDGSCDLEDGDYVSGVKHVDGGERIDWDTLAKDGWDGFSFTLDDHPVYVEPYIDGRARPELLDVITWNGTLTQGARYTPFALQASRPE